MEDQSKLNKQFEKGNGLAKINAIDEVVDIDLLEPVVKPTGGSNIPPAGTTVDETAEIIDAGGVSIKVPKKTVPPTGLPPVTPVDPNNILQPPAYAGGGGNGKDIVDFGDDKDPGTAGSGGGSNIPPGDDPMGPGTGSGGGKGDFKFEIPTSVLTGNNDAIAEWAVDILDQLVLNWMRDRPSISKSDIYQALLKENVRSDVKKKILQRIDEWNKYVHDKIKFTREERDALVGCLVEILKNNTQIAETLTAEVRAMIMASLILFNKYRDSAKEMPTGFDLAAVIRDDIKNAPKEPASTSKAKAE